MNIRAVAARYARALYENAAQKKELDTVAGDIEIIDEIISRIKEVRDYCDSLHADRAKESVFIESAFVPYVSPLTGSMLKIAVKNGRLAAVSHIPAVFRKIMDIESGVTEILIESARHIDKETADLIAKRIAERIGKKTRLKKVLVPGILGGFRIIWDNRMIDMSASGRIKRLRALMTGE